MIAVVTIADVTIAVAMPVEAAKTTDAVMTVAPALMPAVGDAIEAATTIHARKDRAVRENLRLNVVTSLISTCFTRMITTRGYPWNLDLSSQVCLNHIDSLRVNCRYKLWI